MRAHLIKCFKNCKLEPFPVQKKRRRHEKILTKQELEIYSHVQMVIHINLHFSITHMKITPALPQAALNA